jgi:hypothetical protein
MMKQSFFWMVLLFLGTTALQQCTDDGNLARRENTPSTAEPHEKDFQKGRIGAQPVFTIKPAALNYTMWLNGQSGTLYIDWGDGSSEPFMLDGMAAAAKHSYAAPGDYEIHVTGDIDKIGYFSSYYDEGAVTGVDVSGLTALTVIEMGFMNGPTAIDLSKNTLLTAINMPRVAQLKQVALAPQTVINYIEVGGPNQMATADIDALIDQVHAGATSNSTMNGLFFLNGRSFPDSGAVGPPSPAGWAKLRDLQDNYGWDIQPIP